MLGKRSAQHGLFEADHLYLSFVGEDSFYGFLACQRGELFRDEELLRHKGHARHVVGWQWHDEIRAYLTSTAFLVLVSDFLMLSLLMLPESYSPSSLSL